MQRAREKDLARILRRSKPWEKRHIEGWRSFKGGVAWTMLQGGIPCKVRVHKGGLIDDWPYHIAFCQIISMDASATLTHGSNRTGEWWKLADRNGHPIWRTRRATRQDAECLSVQGT